MVTKRAPLAAGTVEGAGSDPPWPAAAVLRCLTEPPTLDRLAGGSSGGSSNGSDTSNHGGAIELGSGSLLTIGANGTVNLGGGGPDPGYAVGGGSGDGILEAPTVIVRGILTVNGGSGSGTGNSSSCPGSRACNPPSAEARSPAAAALAPTLTAATPFFRATRRVGAASRKDPD